MTATWENIAWIFEPDGSLRDIYVQDISIDDWCKLIDFLNATYNLKYGITCTEKYSKQIDKDYIFRYLTDDSGEMESKSVTIDLEGVNINCHFFLPDQIEFDIDPKEIKTIEDYRKIEGFMISVSDALRNQVTLTGDNDIKYPLIKIDVTKGINKFLTKDEMKTIFKRTNSLKSRIGFIQTRLLMKFFPRKFEENVLNSAISPYKSTSKKNNVW